jgi:hypothetical protein
LPEDGADHYSLSHTRHGVAFRHGRGNGGDDDDDDDDAEEEDEEENEAPVATATSASKRGWAALKKRFSKSSQPLTPSHK